MVETFLSDAPHEALADRIGSGSVIRSLEKFDATGRHHPQETGSKLAVIIPYQILRSLPIRGSLPNLLRHPGIRRGSRHADVDHLPRLQFDEEESKERSKEEIGHL